ncbi:MAG: PHP domain-containing protein [Deltaproteobacteria bacterium]
MGKYIDLHVHTTASDGSFKPYELVKYASEKGLCAIAITDHDTVSGINEAEKAGDKFGVEIIPGLEISVDHESEMHILGYFIKASGNFEAKLENLRLRRNLRNEKIINKLRHLGFDISIDDIINEAQGESIGRPHIASLMMRKGYVKSIYEAFEIYLGEGKKAYYERERISPKEGIELIKCAGGIPVLAHPKYLNQNRLEEVVVELKDTGIQGIEVYYSLNKKEETKRYSRLAKKYGLIATGGTDFHGANKPDIDIGRGLGDFRLEYDVVEKMKFIIS